MTAPKYRWTDVAEDNPIPLLTRRKVEGERMMVAEVRLAKGCHVPAHSHDSEQIAVVVSGRVRWRIGEEGSPDRQEFEMTGGELLHLPSNVTHSLDTLEDTVIFDMFSPVGPMGVDTLRATTAREES